MFATRTSLPKLAPAQAAAANGIAMSARPADMLLAAPPHATYRLELGLFRNGSNAQRAGSEGVQVM